MEDTTEAVREATVCDGKIVFEGKALETRDIHIEGVRGSGANGIIFDGRDTMLDRPVVAKLYLPKKGDTRDKRTQAIQEGRKLARLRHRNIVQVFAAYSQDVGMLNRGSGRASPARRPRAGSPCSQAQPLRSRAGRAC
jgi:hypothetical protein